MQLQEKVFPYIILILNPLRSGHRPEERLRFSVWSHGTVPAFFHQDDDIFAHKHGILTLESGKEKAYHLEISLIE